MVAIPPPDTLVGEDDPRPPEVSVIVPAYKSERTIRRCLEALAAQTTRRRFEILVVDSGPDRTAEMARELLARVRVFKLSQRAHAPVARNHGAHLARGAVLAFIDSDAYAAPDWVDRACDAAACGYDLACGSIGNANPDSGISRAEALLMHSEFLPEAPQGPSWFALSGNMVLTRKAYERFGPFIDVRAAEDIVFSRRLIEAGGRILFFPSLVAYHDNRTTLRPFLRNQVVVGKHTAIARRLVSFADTASYGVFLLLLPLAPFAKMAKLTIRMMRWDRTSWLRILHETPWVFAGMLAYTVGMFAGVFTRTPPRPVTLERVS